MTDCPRFESEPLLDVIEHLESRLDAGALEIVIEVSDPDLGRGRFAGETVEVDGRARIHRPFRVWVDLAERLNARLLTPRPLEGGFVRLTFEPLRLPTEETSVSEGPTSEKYGQDSAFARIHKLEEPGFVLDVAQALSWMPPCDHPRILELGTNRGDAWALLRRVHPSWEDQATFVGIDHSASALELAKRRFPEARFIRAELAELPALDLGEPFDLVLAVGTFQSPGVDDRALLRHVVQQRLTASGMVLLGIPNCRYLDGEISHGARMKNYSEPELSLVIKDIAYYRRYLQQHQRRVRVTGKHYLWVTGIPLGGPATGSSG